MVRDLARIKHTRDACVRLFRNAKCNARRVRANTHPDKEVVERVHVLLCRELRALVRQECANELCRTHDSMCVKLLFCFRPNAWDAAELVVNWARDELLQLLLRDARCLRDAKRPVRRCSIRHRREEEHTVS